MEGQIKCQQCLNSLYSANKIKNGLQFKKDKGGLRYPSRDFIKLCFVAEDIHRKTILFKKYRINQLLQECLKKCEGLNLFLEVPHNISSAIHHPLLIKAICKKYLNVRIHYTTKSMIKENSIRNFYTKLILFKGQ
ncbi:unnamed protein product [Euphydryas editha]|uniref:Uncharacterized protein n=1 Tax=Euphydryas editha TaxID=104508 RepID=A0AAU9USA9_EUPED|nr:unnamed protein product [Euphydryas editha]